MRDKHRNHLIDILQNKIFLKLIATIAIISTTIATIIAWNHPATEFEISIYGSTPICFWILFILSVCCSFLLLINVLFHPNLPKYLMYLAFGSIFINSMILSSLYVIRGYYMFNVMGDCGSHIGWANNVLETSFTTSQYPGIYFQSVSLNQLTGIDLETLININSIFYYVVLLLGLFLLARQISTKKTEIGVIFFLGSFYLFGSAPYMASSTIGMYTPYIMALFLFPMCSAMVYQCIKSTIAWPFGLTSLILIVSIMVHHLLIGAFVVAFLFCVIVQVVLSKILVSRKSIDSNKYGNTQRFGPISLLFTVTIVLQVAWISLVGRLNTPIAAIKDFFSLDVPITPITSTSTPTTTVIPTEPTVVTPTVVPTTPTISSTEVSSAMLSERGNNWAEAFITLFNQTPLEIVDYIFKYVGLLLILGCIAIIIIPYIAKHIIREREYLNFISMYLFAGVSGILALLPLLNMTSGYEPGRPMFCIVLLGILCTGVFVVHLFEKVQTMKGSLKVCKQVVLAIFILLIVVTLVYLGVISCYHSVDTRQTSYQTTQSHVNSMDFYLKYTDLNAEVLQDGFFTPSRFVTSIYHSHAMVNPLSTKQFKTIEYVDSVEEHFGYSNALSTFASTSGSAEYLAVMQRDVETRQYMVDVYNRPDLFTEIDRKHLSFDYTVAKYYDAPAMEFFGISHLTI